ncbi:hypothetical protein R1sor_009249 [Riccia sorocarpa]|uniref:Uncharacterized protein n=1 Tax=Riccia sorocarpa TaxID=122646 RepID=A0ABD3H8S7_9MARC
MQSSKTPNSAPTTPTVRAIIDEAAIHQALEQLRSVQTSVDRLLESIARVEAARERRRLQENTPTAEERNLAIVVYREQLVRMVRTARENPFAPGVHIPRTQLFMLSTLPTAIIGNLESSNLFHFLGDVYRVLKEPDAWEEYLLDEVSIQKNFIEFPRPPGCKSGPASVRITEGSIRERFGIQRDVKDAKIPWTTDVDPYPVVLGPPAGGVTSFCKNNNGFNVKHLCWSPMDACTRNFITLLGFSNLYLPTLYTAALYDSVLSGVQYDFAPYIFAWLRDTLRHFRSTTTVIRDSKKRPFYMWPLMTELLMTKWPGIVTREVTMRRVLPSKELLIYKKTLSSIFGEYDTFGPHLTIPLVSRFKAWEASEQTHLLNLRMRLKATLSAYPELPEVEAEDEDMGDAKRPPPVASGPTQEELEAERSKKHHRQTQLAQLAAVVNGAAPAPAAATVDEGEGSPQPPTPKKRVTEKKTEKTRPARITLREPVATVHEFTPSQGATPMDTRSVEDRTGKGPATDETSNGTPGEAGPSEQEPLSVVEAWLDDADRKSQTIKDLEEARSNDKSQAEAAKRQEVDRVINASKAKREMLESQVKQLEEKVKEAAKEKEDAMKDLQEQVERDQKKVHNMDFELSTERKRLVNLDTRNKDLSRELESVTANFEKEKEARGKAEAELQEKEQTLELQFRRNKEAGEAQSRLEQKIEELQEQLDGGGGVIKLEEEEEEGEQGGELIVIPDDSPKKDQEDPPPPGGATGGGQSTEEGTAMGEPPKTTAPRSKPTASTERLFPLQKTITLASHAPDRPLRLS